MSLADGNGPMVTSLSEMTVTPTIEVVQINTATQTATAKAVTSPWNWYVIMAIAVIVAFIGFIIRKYATHK